MLIPAAVSISLSASANGTPSRAASRRPIEDFPAPIMPMSTTEREPSAATRAATALVLSVTSCVARTDMGLLPLERWMAALVSQQWRIGSSE
jgi:hypothetical protein